jgi:hypothetical protein
MFLAMGRLGIIAFLVFLAWTFLVWTAGTFLARPTHLFLIWLGVPTLSLLILVGLSWAIAFYQSLPGVVFPDSVGFTPTPDVVIINSLRHEPIDWDDSYLEFYASDSTVDRILKTGFVQFPAAECVKFKRDIESYMAPSWWNPPAGPNIRICARFQDKDLRFHYSYRLLIYDPSAGDAAKRHIYFRHRH